MNLLNSVQIDTLSCQVRKGLFEVHLKELLDALSTGSSPFLTQAWMTEEELQLGTFSSTIESSVSPTTRESSSSSRSVSSFLSEVPSPESTKHISPSLMYSHRLVRDVSLLLRVVKVPSSLIQTWGLSEITRAAQDYRDKEWRVKGMEEVTL